MNKSSFGAIVFSAMGLLATAHAAETAPIIGGVVEVEITADSIAASTVVLAVNKQVNDMVSAEMSLLYEGATTDIDTASITIASQDNGWHVTSGQFFVPFGSFDSNMISDPVTLELGETRANALQLGYEYNGFGIAAYTAAGASSLDTTGVNLGYQYEGKDIYAAILLGGTTDLSKSAGIDSTDQVIGQSISAVFEINGFSVIYENIAATSAFTTGTLTGQAPIATNIELGYGFQMGGKDTILALSGQTSEGANGLLPQTRAMLTFSSEVMKGTSLGLEYMQETDYASAISTAITAKLAVEF